MQQNPFLFLFVWSNRSELLAGDDTTLSDTSLLTSELAEVVKLSATYLTVLVDLDAVDVRRLDWEDTLYTYSSRHLANGEALLVSVTRDLDYNTTVELDTLLRTLDNFVSDCDCVTRTELWELLAGCKCFLSNFN